MRFQSIIGVGTTVLALDQEGRLFEIRPKYRGRADGSPIHLTEGVTAVEVPILWATPDVGRENRLTASELATEFAPRLDATVDAEENDT